MISDKGIPTSVVSEALDRVAVARWTQAVGEKGRSDNGVRPGDDVTFLIGGDETFAAMYKAICTAKKPGHYIYLLGWYLDETLDLLKKRGTSVKSLFSEASGSGVQIRVMVWDARPKDNFGPLIKWINELPTGAGILDNNTLYFPEAVRKAEPRFEWARSNRAGSHHQKVLLVKGQEDLIAFCGGVDINRDRVYETKGQPGSPMHECSLSNQRTCCP